MSDLHREKRNPTDLTVWVKERGRKYGADSVRIGPSDRWDNDFNPSDDESVVPSGTWDAGRDHEDVADVIVPAPSGYHPTEILPSCQSVIVVAVRQLDGVMDHTSTKCNTTAVQGTFGYKKLNRTLNTVTDGLARLLEDAGHRSVPLGVGVGNRYNDDPEENPRVAYHDLFSLKRAAVLSGLARRARNGLVAHPEFGPKLRLGCVLTEAPLDPDPLLKGDPCPPGCDICQRVCPTEATRDDGRTDHLRCLAGRECRTVTREEIVDKHLEDAPSELQRDHTKIDGFGNRRCKIPCVTLCPLGRDMPDVLARAEDDFEDVVPKVELQGFPSDLPEIPRTEWRSHQAYDLNRALDGDRQLFR